MMNREKKTYLSSKRVSEMLGIAPQTNVNWRNLGRGPRYVKIGRLVRYDLDDVLAFLEDRKVKTNDQA
jgi:predicted DNA-binding transcriptional regulator AlpA